MDIQIYSALIGAVSGALLGSIFGALSTIIVNKIEWRIHGRLNLQFMRTHGLGTEIDLFFVTIYNLSNFPITIINMGIEDENGVGFFRPINFVEISQQLPLEIQKKTTSNLSLRREVFQGIKDVESLKVVFATTSLGKVLYLKGRALKKSKEQMIRAMTHSENYGGDSASKQETK